MPSRKLIFPLYFSYRLQSQIASAVIRHDLGKNKLLPRLLGGGGEERGQERGKMGQGPFEGLVPSPAPTEQRQFRVVCHVIGRKIMASEGRSIGRMEPGWALCAIDLH